MLVGFPFDRRNMSEIANSVRSFAKLLMWDRVKSTRATLIVKIRVEELSDVPASIVVGESEEFHGESETVPIVIIHQNILGECPPDENPIPPDGNPHPLPDHPNFHPNQHNHFLGPIQQHEAPAEHNNAAPENMNMEQETLEEEDLPGWGHWAMPAPPFELVDQELHEGEFMELNDLMEPLNDDLPDMDLNSDLTISSVNSVVGHNVNAGILLEGNQNLNVVGQAQGDHFDDAANGQNILMGVPDLNLFLGPQAIGFQVVQDQQAVEPHNEG